MNNQKELDIYKSFIKSELFSTKANTFFYVYEEIFKRFRNEKITFVEIGVKRGGSLLMWRDWLGPKARIIGVDLDPNAKKMEKYGLKRGKNSLEIYLMCEIPSNVMLGSEFCEYVDGFSIGSNDLTQMTLGLDRDSGLVSHLFNENNEAVRRMINLIMKICKMKNKKIGICGQAPSDYPEFTEFLVRQGIDSISLMPDSLIKTKIAVKEIEDSMIQIFLYPIYLLRL